MTKTRRTLRVTFASFTLLLASCASIEVPDGYNASGIRYTEDWKAWKNSGVEYTHKYLQISDEIRMTFSYNVQRHYSLSAPEISPIGTVETFWLYIGFAHCSPNAEVENIYHGCIDRAKDAYLRGGQSRPVKPESEGIAWDKNITVYDREKGTILKSLVNPEKCDLTKLCEVYVKFPTADYRPQISISFGSVSINGKAFAPPTLEFEWGRAHVANIPKGLLPTPWYK